MALVQNRLCFTSVCVAKYRLYQTSIRHVVYLCIIDACLQPNASKTKLASPTYHFYLQVTIPVLLYNLYNKVWWGKLCSVL